MKIINFEYQISKHFLCALAYDDRTGLNEKEEEQLDNFVDWVIQNAKDKDYQHGHFAYDFDEDTNFGRCEITGLMSDVANLTYVAYYNDITF